MNPVVVKENASIKSLNKSEDSDTSMLSRGFDLKSLNVSMADPEKIAGKTATPFGQRNLDSKEQPEFSLPACYTISKPILRIKMIGLFCTATLFYVFYNMPGEMLQAFAAEELYRRNWQYSPNGSSWFSQTAGAWTTFDVEKWEVVPCERGIPNHFLLKEDVRVKKNA